VTRFAWTTGDDVYAVFESTAPYAQAYRWWLRGAGPPDDLDHRAYAKRR
jgi:hypothetical protein